MAINNSAEVISLDVPQSELETDRERSLLPFFSKLLHSLHPKVLLFITKEQSELNENLILALNRTTPSSASAIAPEQLALEYENLLGGKRKKLAAFYSTPAIVQHLVSNLFEHYQPAESILDPACGTGVYLLACFQTFLSKTHCAEDALTHLYAVDIDPIAVDVTRLLLLDKAAHQFPNADLEKLWSILSNNIVHGDSLLEPGIGIDNGLDFHSTFAAVMGEGGFAHIIGNPPYGLSRDSRIDPFLLRALQMRYASWSSGKLNTYMLFIAKGVELLKEGGRLHFVVPNSWLGIASATALRKRLINSNSIAALEHFKSRVFPEPNVEAVVVGIHKGGDKNTQHINLNYFDKPAGTALQTEKLPAAECKKTSDRRLPLLWRADSANVLDQIFEHSIPLSQSGLFVPRIALQAYAKGKGNPKQTAEIVSTHPFDATEQINETFLPYLEGRDISRNQIDWSGSYLSYGEWLAEPQRLEYFTGPRIVLREILGASPYLLQAAYTEEVFLYNKSALHILPEGGCTASHLKALLAILISPLGSFVIRHAGRKSQRRTFPKVLGADLRDFPIPRAFQEHAQALSDSSKNLNESVPFLCNSIVEAYHLTPQHLQIIRE
jgi:tRNA1(Val) A37 N6-methylase TrmN6